ncbi:MAG: TRAP transporter substrate-binding protein DctP [Rhodovulum sp.]
MAPRHPSRRSALTTLAGAGMAGLAAPHLAGAQAGGTVWRVQTVWPGGVGLRVFEDWCDSIAEKTGGELRFQPMPAADLPDNVKLYDALKAGLLEAVNPFTIYAQQLFPAAAFLTSYPMGLRNPHEWDVFYYRLGGLEIARELYATEGLHFVGPIHSGPNIIHSKVPIRSIDDFRGRKMRMPGGMVADVFTAIGAEVFSIPGPEIFAALEDGTIDVADYVGPAVNYDQGFSKVTKYISMGPPGFMSLYQPVDLMDLTVTKSAWEALPPRMKQFVEMETHVYSDLHHAAIQAADQEAWAKFEADGTEVTRLSDEDVRLMTGAAVPIWFDYAGRDETSKRLFRIQLDYMMSGSLGYVDPAQVDWLTKSI